jgi:hypothetical protein
VCILVEVTQLWIESCRKQDVVPVELNRWCLLNITHHRLYALRKAACSLFRSQEIAQVLSRVAVHVKKLIAIHSDWDLHIDFGM